MKAKFFPFPAQTLDTLKDEDESFDQIA